MLAKGVLFSRRWDYYLYFQVFVFFVICALYTCKAEDYARLLDPPPRGGLWRHGYSVLADHRDGNVNCGGQKVQWIVNRGKCGVCGDAANGPQDHDNGGKFDERITVRRLLSGAAFNVSFILSQNISGMLIIQVCPMHNSREPLTEDCFKSNTLSNKEEESLQSIHVKNTQIGKNLPHTYELVLPRDLICEHCVLRWIFMKDDSTCPSCEQKETFVNCADISITPDLNNIATSNDNPRRVKRQLNPFGQNMFGFQSQPGGTNGVGMNHRSSHISGMTQHFGGNNAGSISIQGFNQIGGDKNQQGTMSMSHFGDVRQREHRNNPSVINNQKSSSMSNRMDARGIANQESNYNDHGNMFQNIHNRHHWNSNQETKRNEITPKRSGDQIGSIRNFEMHNDAFISHRNGIDNHMASSTPSTSQTTDPFSINFGSSFRQDLLLRDSPQAHREDKHSSSSTDFGNNFKNANFDHQSSLNINAWEESFDTKSGKSDNKTSRTIMKNETDKQPKRNNVPIFQSIHQQRPYPPPVDLHVGGQTHLRPIDPLLISTNVENQQSVLHQQPHSPLIGNIPPHTESIPPNGALRTPSGTLHPIQNPLAQLIQPNNSPKPVLQVNQIPESHVVLHQGVNSPIVQTIGKPPDPPILTEIVQPIIPPIQKPQNQPVLTEIINPVIQPMHNPQNHHIPLHGTIETILHKSENPNVKTILHKAAFPQSGLPGIHAPLNQNLVILNQVPHSIPGDQTRVTKPAPHVIKPPNPLNHGNEQNIQAHIQPQELLQSNIRAKSNSPEPTPIQGQNFMFQNFHQKSFSHATVMMPDHIKEISNSQSFSQNIHHDLTNNAQSRSESFQNVDKNVVNVPQNQLVHDKTEITSKKRSSTGAIVSDLPSSVNNDFNHEDHFRQIDRINGETVRDQTSSSNTVPVKSHVHDKNAISGNTQSEAIGNVKHMNVIPVQNIVMSPQNNQHSFVKQSETIQGINGEARIPADIIREQHIIIPTEIRNERQNIMAPTINLQNQKLSIDTSPNSEIRTSGLNEQNLVGQNLENNGVHSFELTQVINLPENQPPFNTHQAIIQDEFPSNIESHHSVKEKKNTIPLTEIRDTHSALQHVQSDITKTVFPNEGGQSPLLKSDQTEIFGDGQPSSTTFTSSNRHPSLQALSEGMITVKDTAADATIKPFQSALMHDSVRKTAYLPQGQHVHLSNIPSLDRIPHQRDSSDSNVNLNLNVINYDNGIQKSVSTDNHFHINENDHIRNRDFQGLPQLFSHSNPDLAVVENVPSQKLADVEIRDSHIRTNLPTHRSNNGVNINRETPASISRIQPIHDKRKQLNDQSNTPVETNSGGLAELFEHAGNHVNTQAHSIVYSSETTQPNTASKSENIVGGIRQFDNGGSGVNSILENSTPVYHTPLIQDKDKQLIHKSVSLDVTYNGGLGKLFEQTVNHEIRGVNHIVYNNETNQQGAQSQSGNDVDAIGQFHRSSDGVKSKHENSTPFNGIRLIHDKDKKLMDKNASHDVPNNRGLTELFDQTRNTEIIHANSHAYNSKTNQQSISSESGNIVDEFGQIHRSSNGENSNLENSTPLNYIGLLHDKHKQPNDQHRSPDVTNSGGLADFFQQAGNHDNKPANSIVYKSETHQHNTPPESGNIVNEIGQIQWSNKDVNDKLENSTPLNNIRLIHDTEKQFYDQSVSSDVTNNSKLFDQTGNHENIQANSVVYHSQTSQNNILSHIGNVIKEIGSFEQDKSTSKSKDLMTNSDKFVDKSQSSSSNNHTNVITHPISPPVTSDQQSSSRNRSADHRPITIGFSETNLQEKQLSGSSHIKSEESSSDYFSLNTDHMSANEIVPSAFISTSDSGSLPTKRKQIVKNSGGVSVHPFVQTNNNNKKEGKDSNRHSFEVPMDRNNVHVAITIDKTQDIRKNTQLNFQAGDNSQPQQLIKDIRKNTLFDNIKIDSSLIRNTDSESKGNRSILDKSMKENGAELMPSKGTFSSIKESLTKTDTRMSPGEILNRSSETNNEPLIVKNKNDNTRTTKFIISRDKIEDATNIISTTPSQNDTKSVDGKARVLSVVRISDVDTVKDIAREGNTNHPIKISSIQNTSNSNLKSSDGAISPQERNMEKLDVSVRPGVTSKQHSHRDIVSSSTTSPTISTESGIKNENKHTFDVKASDVPLQSGTPSLLEKIIAFNSGNINNTSTKGSKASFQTQGGLSETGTFNETVQNAKHKSSGSRNVITSISTSTARPPHEKTTSPGSSLLDLIIAFEKTAINNKSNNINQESDKMIQTNKSSSKPNEVQQVKPNKPNTKVPTETSHDNTLRTSKPEVNKNKTKSSGSEVGDQSMNLNDRIIAFNMLNAGGMLPLQEVIVGDVKREKIQKGENRNNKKDKYKLETTISPTGSVNNRVKRSLMGRGFQLSVSSPNGHNNVRNGVSKTSASFSNIQNGMRGIQLSVSAPKQQTNVKSRIFSNEIFSSIMKDPLRDAPSLSSPSRGKSPADKGTLNQRSSVSLWNTGFRPTISTTEPMTNNLGDKQKSTMALTVRKGMEQSTGFIPKNILPGSDRITPDPDVLKKIQSQQYVVLNGLSLGSISFNDISRNLQNFDQSSTTEKKTISSSSAKTTPSLPKVKSTNKNQSLQHQSSSTIKTTTFATRKITTPKTTTFATQKKTTPIEVTSKTMSNNEFSSQNSTILKSVSEEPKKNKTSDKVSKSSTQNITSPTTPIDLTTRDRSSHVNQSPDITTKTTYISSSVMGEISTKASSYNQSLTPQPSPEINAKNSSFKKTTPSAAEQISPDLGLESITPFASITTMLPIGEKPPLSKTPLNNSTEATSVTNEKAQKESSTPFELFSESSTLDRNITYEELLQFEEMMKATEQDSLGKSTTKLPSTSASRSVVTFPRLTTLNLAETDPESWYSELERKLKEHDHYVISNLGQLMLPPPSTAQPTTQHYIHKHTSTSSHRLRVIPVTEADNIVVQKAKTNVQPSHDFVDMSAGLSNILGNNTLLSYAISETALPKLPDISLYTETKIETTKSPKATEPMDLLSILESLDATSETNFNLSLQSSGNRNEIGSISKLIETSASNFKSTSTTTSSPSMISETTLSGLNNYTDSLINSTENISTLISISQGEFSLPIDNSNFSIDNVTANTTEDVTVGIDGNFSLSNYSSLNNATEQGQFELNETIMDTSTSNSYPSIITKVFETTISPKSQKNLPDVDSLPARYEPIITETTESSSPSTTRTSKQNVIFNTTPKLNTSSPRQNMISTVPNDAYRQSERTVIKQPEVEDSSTQSPYSSTSVVTDNSSLSRDISSTTTVILTTEIPIESSISESDSESRHSEKLTKTQTDTEITKNSWKDKHAGSLRNESKYHIISEEKNPMTNSGPSSVTKYPKTQKRNLSIEKFLTPNPKITIHNFGVGRTNGPTFDYIALSSALGYMNKNIEDFKAIPFDTKETETSTDKKIIWTSETEGDPLVLSTKIDQYENVKSNQDRQDIKFKLHSSVTKSGIPIVLGESKVDMEKENKTETEDISFLKEDIWKKRHSVSKSNDVTPTKLPTVIPHFSTSMSGLDLSNSKFVEKKNAKEKHEEKDYLNMLHNEGEYKDPLKGDFSLYGNFTKLLLNSDLEIKDIPIRHYPETEKKSEQKTDHEMYEKSKLYEEYVHAHEVDNSKKDSTIIPSIAKHIPGDLSGNYGTADMTDTPLDTTTKTEYTSMRILNQEDKSMSINSEYERVTDTVLDNNNLLYDFSQQDKPSTQSSSQTPVSTISMEDTYLPETTPSLTEEILSSTTSEYGTSESGKFSYTVPTSSTTIVSSITDNVPVLHNSVISSVGYSTIMPDVTPFALPMSPIESSLSTEQSVIQKKSTNFINEIPDNYYGYPETTLANVESTSKDVPNTSLFFTSTVENVKSTESSFPISTTEIDSTPSTFTENYKYSIYNTETPAVTTTPATVTTFSNSMSSQSTQFSHHISHSTTDNPEPSSSFSSLNSIMKAILKGSSILSTKDFIPTTPSLKTTGVLHSSYPIIGNYKEVVSKYMDSNDTKINTLFVDHSPSRESFKRTSSKPEVRNNNFGTETSSINVQNISTWNDLDVGPGVNSQSNQMTTKMEKGNMKQQQSSILIKQLIEDAKLISFIARNRDEMKNLKRIMVGTSTPFPANTVSTNFDARAGRNALIPEQKLDSKIRFLDDSFVLDSFAKNKDKSVLGSTESYKRSSRPFTTTTENNKDSLHLHNTNTVEYINDNSEITSTLQSKVDYHQTTQSNSVADYMTSDSMGMKGYETIKVSTTESEDRPRDSKIPSKIPDSSILHSTSTLPTLNRDETTTSYLRDTSTTTNNYIVNQNDLRESSTKKDSNAIHHTIEQTVNEKTFPKNQIFDETTISISKIQQTTFPSTNKPSIDESDTSKYNNNRGNNAENITTSSFRQKDRVISNSTKEASLLEEDRPSFMFSSSTATISRKITSVFDDVAGTTTTPTATSSTMTTTFDEVTGTPIALQSTTTATSSTVTTALDMQTNTSPLSQSTVTATTLNDIDKGFIDNDQNELQTSHHETLNTRHASTEYPTTENTHQQEAFNRDLNLNFHNQGSESLPIYKTTFLDSSDNDVKSHSPTSTASTVDITTSSYTVTNSPIVQFRNSENTTLKTTEVIQKERNKSFKDSNTFVTSMPSQQGVIIDTSIYSETSSSQPIEKTTPVSTISTTKADDTTSSSTSTKVDSSIHYEKSTSGQYDKVLNEKYVKEELTYSNQYSSDTETTTSVHLSSKTDKQKTTEQPMNIVTNSYEAYDKVSDQNEAVMPESTTSMPPLTDAPITTVTDTPITSTTPYLPTISSKSATSTLIESNTEATRNVVSPEYRTSTTADIYKPTDYSSHVGGNLVYMFTTVSPDESTARTTRIPPSSTSILKTAIMQSSNRLSTVMRNSNLNNDRNTFFWPNMPEVDTAKDSPMTERNFEMTTSSPTTASIVNDGRTQFSMTRFLQRGSSQTSAAPEIITRYNTFAQQLAGKESTTMPTLKKTDAVKFTLGMTHINRNLAKFFATKPDIYNAPSEPPKIEQPQPSKPTVIPKRRVTGLPLFSSNIITQLPYFYPSTIQKKYGNGKTLNINVRLIPKELVNEEMEPNNYTSINDSFIDMEPIQKWNESISFASENNASLTIDIANSTDHSVNSSFNDLFYEVSKDPSIEPFEAMQSTKTSYFPSLLEFKHSISPIRKIRSTRTPEAITSTTIGIQPTTKPDITNEKHDSPGQTITTIINIFSTAKPLSEQTRAAISAKASTEASNNIHTTSTVAHSKIDNSNTIEKDKVYVTQEYDKRNKSIPSTSSDIQNVDVSPSVHVTTTSKSMLDVTTTNMPSAHVTVTSKSPVDLTTVKTPTATGERRIYRTDITSTPTPAAASGVTLGRIVESLKPTSTARSVTEDKEILSSSKNLQSNSDWNKSPSLQQPVNTIFSSDKMLPSIEKNFFNDKSDMMVSSTKGPTSNQLIRSQSQKTSILLPPSKDSLKGHFAVSSWNDAVTWNDNVPNWNDNTQTIVQNVKLSGNSPSQDRKEQKERSFGTNIDSRGTGNTMSGKLSPLLSPERGWYSGVFVDTMAPSFSDGSVGSLSSSLSNSPQTNNNNLRTGGGRVTEIKRGGSRMADNIWSLSSSSSNSLQTNKNNIRTGRGRITDTKRAGSRMLDNTWSLSTSFSNPLQTSNNDLRAGRGSVTETKGVGSRSLNNMGSFSGSLSNPMQKNNNDLRTGGGRIAETKSTGSRMLDNTWTLSSSFSNPLQTSNNDLRAGRGRITETKRVGSKIVGNTISAPSKSESRVIWRSQSAPSSSDTQGQLSFSNPNIKHKQTAGVRREGDTIHLSSESKSQVLWQPNAVSPLLDIKTKQYFVDYKYPVVRPTEKARDNKLSLLSGVPRHVKTSDFGISFSDNVMSGSLSQIHPKARRRSVPNTALGQQVDRTHNSATVSHPTLSGHVSHRTSLSRHIRSTSTQSSFKTETSNLSQNYVLDAQELCRGKEIFACFGKGRHSKLPGMKWWCVQNCRHGNCPLSKCRCGCQISGSKNLRNIQLLMVQKQIEKNVFPVTTIPSSTRRTVWNCKPTSAYTPVKGLSEWCNRMCSLNACPLNMCDCS